MKKVARRLGVLFTSSFDFWVLLASFFFSELVAPAHLLLHHLGSWLRQTFCITCNHRCQDLWVGMAYTSANPMTFQTQRFSTSIPFVFQRQMSSEGLESRYRLRRRCFCLLSLLPLKPTSKADTSYLYLDATLKSRSETEVDLQVRTFFSPSF